MRSSTAVVATGMLLVTFALPACSGAVDFNFGTGGSGGSAGSTVPSTGTTGGGGSTTTTTTTTGVGAGGSGGSITTTGGTGGSVTTSTTSAGGSSTTTTTDPLVDCAAIPPGPFSFTVKTGHKATEDMDFDDMGNLVGATNGNIFRSTLDGQSTIWVPGAGGFIAGMRFTSNGVLVYADVDGNALYRVDPPATKAFVIGGLSYPNGMDADEKGNITVAEQNSGLVRRVNAMTGESTILASGLSAPNGVSYSPDYKIVYVGSFGGNIIYKIPLDENDNPLPHQVFVQNIFQHGTLDGMGVDACGNVYVCEYIAAKVWRMPPDGSKKELVVDLSSQTGWIPNMGWGSGYGGWDKNTLFVRDISSGKMYEVPVGVPSKPSSYP